MPEDVFEFMTELIKMLKESYGNDRIPDVELDVDSRKHLLDTKKYIQKDVEVTSYYSATTSQQISDSINSLHESWITQIDIQKGILRGPEELQE